MRMAKVETLEEFKDIALLTILYRYTIDKHYGILLGVDSACFKDGCTGKFYSLDGTTDLTAIAEQFNQWIGVGFAPIQGNEVLIMSKGELSTMS